MSQLSCQTLPNAQVKIQFQAVDQQPSFIRQLHRLPAFGVAALSRDQKIRTATETWDVRTMLLVPPKGIVPQAAEDAVDQITDQFVTAFRSVNPQ